MPLSSSFFETLPPLSSAERDGLRSRLEQGLLRLARLSAAVDQEIAEDQTPAAAHVDSPPEVPWILPQAMPGSPSESERRAFPRREGTSRVAVCRLTDPNVFPTPQQMEWRLHSTPLRGTLADLSLNGAALLLSGPLETGETVLLRLLCPRGGDHVDQQATVLRSVSDDEGQWKITCRFKQRLRLEQVSFFSRFINAVELI